MNTIAVDFDGVIHKYSKGWHDGSIYDQPIGGAFESIRKLMDEGNAVFILSTRDSMQIKKWIDKHLTYFYGFRSEVIWQPWIKSWKKKYVLGITNRKLRAMVYIDDRALRFINWKDIDDHFKQ